MWPFSKKSEIAIEVSSDQPSFRCATANILEVVERGEKRKKMPGTKHFRGGAKVYIIDTYPGMCDSAVVVGHHRTSGRYITLSLKAHYLENFRITTVYSPKVIEKVDAHWKGKGHAYHYADEQAEHFLASVEGWATTKRISRRRQSDTR